MLTENDPLVRTQNLTKEFKLNSGSSMKALDKINIDVFSGEFITIIGRSGSGKSTLLNLIGTLDTSTRGAVFFETKNLRKLSDKELALIRRYKIGFIFQTFNLLPILSVKENIELSLYHHGLPENIKKDKINDMLDFFELNDKQDCLPSQLSVGQQQKVAIARALIKEPVVILADEPTGEMDPISASEISDKFSQLNENFKVTIIVATHGVYPLKNSDKQFFLKNGKLVSQQEAGY